MTSENASIDHSTGKHSTGKLQLATATVWFAFCALFAVRLSGHLLSSSAHRIFLLFAMGLWYCIWVLAADKRVRLLGWNRMLALAFALPWAFVYGLAVGGESMLLGWVVIVALLSEAPLFIDFRADGRPSADSSPGTSDGAGVSTE